MSNGESMSEESSAPLVAPAAADTAAKNGDGSVRYHVRIREIPADERPRERLIAYGADTLSTAELLAILLRTGTEKYSAVGLANHLLTHFHGLRGVAFGLRRVEDELAFHVLRRCGCDRNERGDDGSCDETATRG